MWCHHCGQDVPGIASMSSSDGPLRAGEAADAVGQSAVTSPESGPSAPIHFCCARCGTTLGEDAAGPSAFDSQDVAGEPAASTASRRAEPAVSPNVSFDNWQWELDQDLHDVRHLLEARRIRPPVDDDLWNVAEADALAPPMTAAALPVHPPTTASPPMTPSGGRSSFFTWLVLSLSFMAFAGGGVLLGWSTFFNRGDLWSFGLLSAFAGQAGLLFGLVLFLERLWREGRQATTQISEVDQRIGDLQQSAALHQSSLHARHDSPASPHLLVSDLKHQLDVLARQLPDSRR